MPSAAPARSEAASASTWITRQPAATAGGCAKRTTKSGFFPSSTSRSACPSSGAARCSHGSLKPRGLSMGSAGTPVARLSRPTASRRGPRAIAPPSRMTGRRAAASSASACSTSAAVAAPGASRRAVRATSPAATLASSRSPGRLTCTGPGRPLRASSERGRDVLAQSRRVLGHPRGLADRRGHRGLIHLLEGAAPELRGGRVPAQQHHRRLGHQRAVERRDRVAVARPRGDEGHARLLGEPSPRVRHVHRRRLVPRVQDREAAAEARVVEREDLVAREREEVPDAGGGQRLHDQVRAGPGHAGLTAPGRARPPAIPPRPAPSAPRRSRPPCW